MKHSARTPGVPVLIALFVGTGIALGSAGAQHSLEEAPARPASPADLSAPAASESVRPTSDELALRRELRPVAPAVTVSASSPLSPEFPAARAGAIDARATWVASEEMTTDPPDETHAAEPRHLEPYELRFVGGSKRPAPGLDPALQSRLAYARSGGTKLAETWTYAFLMVRGRLTPEREEEVTRLGVRLLQRHPCRSWKVRLPLSALEAVAALPYVHWLGYPDPAQKLDPALQAGLRLWHASATPARFYLHVMEDDSSPEAVETTREFGDATQNFYHPNGPQERALIEAGFTIEQFDRRLKMYIATGPHAAVERVLARDWVHFVEYEPPARLHIDQSTPLVAADEFWGGSYTGDNVQVGLIDSGSWSGPGGHADLDHIVGCGINYTPEAGTAFNDLRGHGTHVTGIMLANSDCDGGKHRGMAPGIGTNLYPLRVAKCFVAGTGSYSLASAMDWMATSNPCNTAPPTAERAHVVNNSWGNDCQTAAPVGTDGNSLKADDKVYTDNIVMVFSAGNGRDADCDGTADYFGAGSIGTPGAAKNVLTVGACSDEKNDIVGDLVWFSSQGPTGDNRKKPDLNAPGCDDGTQVALGTGNKIWAADSDSPCDMFARCGTSMAAPHVTGLVASLMDHYSWLKNDPSLVKAWLMARAIPHNNSLATSRDLYGTGRIDAYAAHYDYAGANGWDGGSFHGAVDYDTWIHGDITVPVGATRLIAVMAWDEPPASAGATASVTYDLNLYADRSPFSGSPDVGDYAAVSSSDNVEVIRIDNPVAGDYRLKVHNLDAPGPLMPDLHVDVAWLVVVGDTSPTHTLTLNAPSACVQPFTDCRITATASFSAWIGSCLQVRVDPLPFGVTITDLDTIREDGTNYDYDADDDEITLGDIHTGDTRAVTWAFRAGTEGRKTISMTSDTDNAGSVTQTFEFDVDGTEPGLPAFTGSTPATGHWTNDATPSVTWTAATDDRCGVDGYGERWSTSSTDVPGEIKDLEETATGTTSAALADGSWYYTLKAMDNAGNWTTGATRTGPFLIDATPPGSVTNLSSTSHAVDAWSADPTIDFAWTAAADNLSGVDGYGINLTVGEPGIPAASKDLEEVNSYTTTARTSHDAHYFNIRSVDQAGNWDGDFISVGPFKIDTIDPTAVSNLGSGSHTVGSYSATRVVQVGWNAGSDAHSGVAGYSFLWTPSGVDVPDLTVETPILVTSSPILSDGDWWFHVRTVDRVGHGSSTQHIGPFRIDGTLPTNPVLSSSSHVPGGCSNDCTIDVNWSGATGMPFPAATGAVGAGLSPRGMSSSGVAGYSIEWSTAAGTTPDASIDTALQSAISPCLADGSWYFHLRTADNAGNWSGAAHLGPFKLDDTLPTNPTSITSSSHPPATWRADATIDAGWSGAADTGCGVQGYSIEWTSNPFTLPDASTETVGASGSSPPLADGHGWYLHVRAVDAAGNAAAGAAHLGPFWIDTTSPTARITTPNGGETLMGGSNATIGYTAVDLLSGLSNIRIEYSLDGGATWAPPIFDGPDPGGTVNWAVPDVASLTARVRVTARDRAANLTMDLSDADFSIAATTAAPEAPPPPVLALQPNLPNPFQFRTAITFDLARDSQVRLAVFDAAGRRIAGLAAGPFSAGRHQLDWNGRDELGRAVPSGIYFLQLEAGGLTQTRKIVASER